MSTGVANDRTVVIAAGVFALLVLAVLAAFVWFAWSSHV